MTHYTKEFPFKEIRDDGTPEGDYFHRPQDIRKLGYAESQIWSIYEGDEEIRKDGQRFSVYVYGPSRHYINVIGYIATKEHHDGNTYYAETLEMEPYPEGWDDDL